MGTKTYFNGVKGTSPLVGGSREGKALSIFLHLYILKSTALGLRGGVANPSATVGSASPSLTKPTTFLCAPIITDKAYRDSGIIKYAVRRRKK